MTDHPGAVVEFVFHCHKVLGRMGDEGRHLDGGMRHKPGWVLVAALEIFDEEAGTARKAPIFSADLLTPPIEATTANTAEEALALALERIRRVDLDPIVALLETSIEEASDLLTGLVYPSLDDPDELVPAVTALWGNVRAKLVQAMAAAATNPR